MRIRPWSSAALTAALCACGLWEPAGETFQPLPLQDLPAAGYQRAVLDCLDEARADTDADPTTLPCDWELITEAALAGSLTGRYALEGPQTFGALLVLEPPDQDPFLALQAVNGDGSGSCGLSGGASREGRDLVYRTADASGCRVRFAPSAEGLTVLAEGECSGVCSPGGRLEGSYGAMAP